jgi:hypothetical protein
MSLRYQITFYGYPDNDPPNSDAIAYPRSDGYKTLHNRAAGAGDWRDPITFAAGRRFQAQNAVGTRIYVPYLEKYFILEDSCASCSLPNWVDLWIGGKGFPKRRVLNQEDYLTRLCSDGGEEVIVRPARDLPVDPTPLMEVRR